MNRQMDSAFKEGRALIPFITCGDPSLEVTEELVLAMDSAGADMIELGIPFSDPTAEKELIQDSNDRALRAGTTTDHIFSMVERIRKECDVPIMFTAYANVIFTYGIEKFFQRTSETGVHGIIIFDVPYEEKEEFDSVARKYGVKLISFIASRDHARIDLIAKDAEGFLYIDPSIIEEGGRFVDMTDLIKEIKDVNDLPCVTHADLGAIKNDPDVFRCYDGINIVAAIVEMCETYREKSVEYAADYVREMRECLDSL